jgi:hypothetical protein
MVFFVYKVSTEVVAKFCQNPNLCQKFRYVQISPIQQPDQVSMALTPKSVTDWSQMMNHRKAERVTYWLGIRQFGSFRFA